MNIANNRGCRVSLPTKVAYGVGGLSDSIKTFSFTTFLLFYYTSVLGLPGTWLGVAMAVGLVWDAFVDPLIGHASDRSTVRVGRRHSFMFVGAVGAGASFAAVFNPPSGLSAGWLFAWLMMTSLSLRSTISLFMVPYYALGAELTTDYHERTSISGYRAGAVLLGTLLTTMAAFLVFFPSDGVVGVDAKFAPGSYEAMGAVFGLAITVVGLTATFGTLRERSRLTASSGGRPDPVAFHRTLLGPLRDHSFRVVVASSALSFMATAVNAALALHFLTYHVRLTSTHALSFYFAGFYLGALAGVFIWVRVTRRIEKHKVYAVTTVLTAVVISGGYWLVGDQRPFGTDHLLVVVIGSCLAGFFGTAGIVIVPSMIADIVALDHLRTGRRRDGVTFGIYSLGQQVSGGFAVLLAGVLVDRFAGLVPAQAEQSAVTAERLAMISSLLPALLLLAAGMIAFRYRLTRRHVQCTQRELIGSI